MLDFLLPILQGLPPEAATVLLAMLPVGELRLALPYALVVYKLPLYQAVLLSVLGNMLPVYFLLLFFERAARWLQAHSVLADRVLSWLFERTRRKLSSQVERYEHWALAMFVAVPLPATGAWTGALAAFVFGLPRKRSFVAILAGVCGSAIIVTLLTLGTSLAISSILNL
jgi:uncharacterized membrane protein